MLCNFAPKLYKTFTKQLHSVLFEVPAAKEIEKQYLTLRKALYEICAGNLNFWRAIRVKNTPK